MECDSTSSYRANIGSTQNPVYTCVSGGIDNCVEYEVDESFCVRCDTNVYVKEGNCVQHEALENCLEKDEILKNTCKTCD